MSNEKFKADFAKLLKAAGDKAELVVRKTALELQSSMVQMSPVDTGRFKGNWQAGIGSANTARTDRLDTTPLGSKDDLGAALATEAVLKGWKAGQTIYLTNSLPYARRLEYGWSKQSPQGMVRLTVQNFSNHLADAVRSIK